MHPIFDFIISKYEEGKDLTVAVGCRREGKEGLQNDRKSCFLFLSLDYMMDEESFTILDYGCPLQTLVITIYDVKEEEFESGLF